MNINIYLYVTYLHRYKYIHNYKKQVCAGTFPRLAGQAIQFPERQDLLGTTRVSENYWKSSKIQTVYHGLSWFILTLSDHFQSNCLLNRWLSPRFRCRASGSRMDLTMTRFRSSISCCCACCSCIFWRSFSSAWTNRNHGRRHRNLEDLGLGLLLETSTSHAQKSWKNLGLKDVSSLLLG